MKHLLNALAYVLYFIPFFCPMNIVAQDIALMINNNNAHSYTLQYFIKELSNTDYPHIIFSSQAYQSAQDILTHPQGFYTNKVMSIALEQLPEYSGYLFTDNQTAPHTKKLDQLTTPKMLISYWCGEKLIPSATGWWWYNPWGYQALAKAASYTAQHNDSKTTMLGYADVVYINTTYENEPVVLCTILAHENSFLRIAPPTQCARPNDSNTWQHHDGLADIIKVSKNLQATNVENQSEPFGKDTLLIINYNHAHYQSIPFLKEIYKPYFPHIVFYGPEEHPDVELCKHFKGFYSYNVLSKAMQKYPNHKGYFLVHDDCVINPWNLQRFDPTKIWVAYWWQEKLIPEPKGWWWPQKIGYRAIKNAYAHFPEKNKVTLQKNCGEHGVMAGYSDIAYIPAKYKDQVINLCAILSNESTFLEIALPTILGCLDDKNNWEYFNGFALWRKEDPKNMYSKNLDYMHPFKFSDTSNQDFIREQFKSA